MAVKKGVSPTDTRRFYREYIFMREAEMVNQARVNKDEKPLTVRQLDNLHDNLAALLARYEGQPQELALGRAVTDAGDSQFITALNEVLSPLYPDHANLPIYDELASNTHPTFDSLLRSFRQISHYDPIPISEDGQTMAPQSMINKVDENGKTLMRERKDPMTGDVIKDEKTDQPIMEPAPDWSKCVVPLSPYDAEFRDSELMLKNAPEMLYADLSGDNSYNDYKKNGKPMFVSRHSIDMYHMERSEQLGAIGSDYDRCGITKLAPYMSEEEYDNVKDWATYAIGTLPDPNDPNETIPYPTPDVLDNSVAILEYLRSAGYDYTIKPDTRRGEIVAQLSRPYAKIRILDTAPNHSMIGHTNVDGSNWYLATNERRNHHLDIYPTTKDTVDLVKFALGNTVESPEDPNKIIGEPATYDYGEKNAAFVNEKKASFLYRSLNKDDKIIIHREREENANTIQPNQDPELYLEESVESARANFYNALDVDALIKANNEGTEPNFSTDPDIEIIQEGYWELLTGKADTLLKPGTDIEAYKAYKKEHEDMSDATHQFLKALSLDTDETDLVYENDAPEEIIRAHARDMTDYYIGHYPKHNEITVKEGSAIDLPMDVHETETIANTDGTITHIFDIDGPGARNVTVTDPDTGISETQTIGTTFNLVNTAYYMNSKFTPEDSQTSLIKNIQMLPEFDQDSFLGNTDYNTTVLKNRLLVFDPDSAIPMYKAIGYTDDNGNTVNYIKDFGEVIKETIHESACEISDDDILIDKNGVVQYTAYRHTHQNVICKNGNKDLAPGDPYPNEAIVGTLGQIFIPDEKGMITTKYAGTNNRVIVPGYTATILSNKPGETKPVAERLRLYGYKHEMNKMIRETVKADVLMATKTTGSTTSLNGVYKHLYDTKYDIGYPTSANNAGMPVDITDRTIKTMSNRVRFSKDYSQNAGIDAYYRAQKNKDKEKQIQNDNFHSDWRDLDGTPISVLLGDKDNPMFAGIFDPSATTDAKSQGLTRYGVDGLKINNDGSVTAVTKPDPEHPGDYIPDPNAQTALMKAHQMRYQNCDPFDRRLMAFMNLGTALRVTEPVMAAQMTFGGYTFDDGYVISKDFAQRYGVREDGEYHDLRIGDKVSDFHGNKGVISLIVDKDAIKNMKIKTDEPAWNVRGLVNVDAAYNGKTYQCLDIDPNGDIERQCKENIFAQINGDDVLQATLWFEKNPDLDVVSAPYSYPSRYNGGSARELMEHPCDLVSPDGTKMKGAAGYEAIIVTDKTVEDKTTIYDSYGNYNEGRKASSQFAWTCASKDCPAIMRELYGANTSGMSDLKEYLMLMGYDMDGQGTVHYWIPTENDGRMIFELPDALNYTDEKKQLKLTELTTQFTSDLAHRGGYMELPFPLTLKDGETTPKRGEDKDTYLLPVMSSHLRAENRLEDGRTLSHAYTQKYVDIYGQACRYLDYQSKIDKIENKEHPTGTDLENLNKYKYQQKCCVKNAQSTYNYLADKVAKEKLTDSKHNIFRDKIMSHPTPNSATAVWTADPTLKLNEVALPPKMARAMHVKNGDSVLVWRDPLLRDSGVKYLNVTIKDGLTGIAINPVIDKPFDGDFDGDSVAVVNLTDPEAQKEAKEKFSMESNLLNLGELDEETHTHPLSINTDLDLKTMANADSSICDQNGKPLTVKELFKKVETDLNAVENDETISEEKRKAVQSQAIDELTACVQHAFNQDFGTACVNFENLTEHMKSLDEIVVTQKAKGSAEKLDDYAKYLGIYVERSTEYDPDKGKDIETYIKPDTLIDLRDPNSQKAKEMLAEAAAKEQALLKKAEQTADPSIKKQYEDEAKNAKLLADSDDDKTVMLACAIKAFGTGIAGAYSQRGIRMLRNDCPAMILELTYPVTQATLQGKHEAEKVYMVYDLMNGAAKALWRGEVLERQADGSWTQAPKKYGKTQKADKETWIDQMTTLYKEGFGIDAVNTDYIKAIADKLCDENGKMLGIEDQGLLDKKASPLDRLAYPGTKGDNMSFLKRCAQEELNLFSADCLKHEKDEPQKAGQTLQFAPQGMYDSCMKGTENDITSNDCKDTYTRRSKQRIAVTREPKRFIEDQDILKTGTYDGPDIK